MYVTLQNFAFGPEILMDDAVSGSAPPPYSAYPTAPAQVATAIDQTDIAFCSGSFYFLCTWDFSWIDSLLC